MSLYVLENHCLQTHREHQVQMVRRESLVNLEAWDCLERVFVNKRKDVNVYNIMLTNHRVVLETMVILVYLVNQDQWDCLEKL